jgi:hypothetical protein
VCGRLGIRATLNLGVTDGKAMAFARHSTEGPGNSLYFVEDGEALPGAVVVASERLDGDPRWREVPDQHLLTLDGDGTSLRTLYCRIASLLLLPDQQMPVSFASEPRRLLQRIPWRRLGGVL